MGKNALSSASVTPEEPRQLDYHAMCKIRQVTDRIGDRWTLPVIYQLGSTTKRFTELRRALPGISQRMLTATLRDLERDGLVSRTVHAVVPPKVEYRITPMGQSLTQAVSVLLNWAYDNSPAIDAARTDYDARVES
jgi:DNA-binding HxlR family transcriptional regulator